MATIWDPIRIGRIDLPHRFAMAPMTRSRAEEDGSPNALMAKYYAQRAGLGLLITEGTQPSDVGKGYPNSPGIYTPAHIEGWRTIADAVHEAGGYLFIQLMHAGRVTNSYNLPKGSVALAPSAISAGHDIFTAEGYRPVDTPRALEVDEISRVQAEYVHASASAIEAGADGVEIHGANGYLPWQFLNASANTRSDQYGGSVENRARFLLETTQKVADRIGADRVGVRLSPAVNFLGLDEGPDWQDTYRYTLRALDKMGLAYLHLFYFGDDAFLREMRKELETPLLLVRAGRDYASIAQDMADGVADVFPIATDALANPDLIERLSSGAPIQEADKKTFYGGGAEGYIDYPSLKGDA